LWPFDSIYIELYDFDRSKGELNIAMRDTIKNNRVHGTLAFSPSGQYMYVSNHYAMFQYDISASDIKSTFQKIADYDGHKFKYNEFDDGRSTEFGVMAHGPDGKIYIVPESSNRYLHTIEYPDEVGLASNLVQRKYMIPTSNHVGVPNFPHYRLGPLDGSPADTLGLDNHPIAKFRYESDTNSYLDVRFTDLSYYRPESWFWDFGDGTTFTGKKPYVHSFSKEGTYSVCLTVSNENSTNTSCKSITIGPNATDDDAEIDNKLVTLFPNPVDQEMILTIQDYIPKHGIVEIYDVVGQKVKIQSVYNGWNNIDVSQLNTGTYIYIVSDGHKKIAVGRFVKI
jgi:PKD repeat protein